MDQWIPENFFSAYDHSSLASSSAFSTIDAVISSITHLYTSATYPCQMLHRQTIVQIMLQSIPLRFLREIDEVEYKKDVVV